MATRSSMPMIYDKALCHQWTIMLPMCTDDMAKQESILTICPPTPIKLSGPVRLALKHMFQFQTLTEPHSPENMCYYDQYRWACGDWKWGNFKRHCQNEYRMGETCGMKLIYNTLPTPGNCPLCEKIEKKQRRYEKMQSDYMRWYQDPARQASAAKAYEDMKIVLQEINTIRAERQSRMQSVGNPRRSQQTRHAA